METNDNPFLIWGERLLADPNDAIDAILTGRGARGMEQGADPDDFLADLVDHPHWRERRDALIHALDAAAYPWLLERSQWGLAAMDRFGVRAYVTRLAEGLSVVAHLPLVRTAYQLMEHRPHWERFCNTLRWPGELDLHWSYDQVLIAHQPDERFVPRWFAACDRAAWGGPYWMDDFTTGILGLRKLPPQPNTQPERRVALALARFALFAGRRGNAMEGERTLRGEGQSMRLLYPRSDRHWAMIWRETLEMLPRDAKRDERDRLARWLGDLLPAGGGKSGRKPAARQSAGNRVRLPGADERAKLKAEIQHAGQISENLWSRFRALMTRHWTYAEASGESYFAVRTLNNLGHSLLRLDPDTPMLERLQAWTRRAIGAEPEHAHSWGLWAVLLERLGQHEVALAVRWEAVRRFPNDPVLRNELAQWLIRRGRTPVAERLLRESMRDFPRNEVCRTMLAELLRDDGRTGEAEALLRKTLRDFPRDEHCRTMLAELLWDDGRTEEAEALLRETMRDFPRNEVCRNALAELLRDDGRAGEAEALLRETMKRFPRDAVCRHVLAHLLLDRDGEGDRAAAEGLLAELEYLAPNDPYVRGLAGRIRGDGTVGRDRTKTGFAARAHPRPPTRGASPPGLADPAENAYGSIDYRSIPTIEHSMVACPRVSYGVSSKRDPHEEGSEGIECETESGAIRKDTPSPPEGPAQDQDEFLRQLQRQVPWLEAYYGGDGEEGEPRQALESGSELAQVIAWRRGEAVPLALWQRAQPGSYPIRLIAAWRGEAVGADDFPLDAGVLDALAREFPGRHRRHDWLRFSFLPPDRREAMVSEARREAGLGRDAPNHALWGGRLAAVYPDLDEPERPQKTPADRRGALRGLVADIALAEAERVV